MEYFKLRMLFLYQGELYLRIGETEEELFEVKAIKREINEEFILNKIEQEFYLKGEEVIKFSEETNTGISTFIVKCDCSDSEKFIQINNSNIKRLSKKNRIACIQGSMELKNHNIETKVYKEIDNLKRTLNLSISEKLYYDEVKEKLYKNREDYTYGNTTMIAILGLIMAVILERFIIKEYLGISVFIYTVVFMGVIYYIYKDKIIYRNWKVYFLGGSAVVLSTFAFIYSNMILQIFNIIGIIIFINSSILVGKNNYDISFGLFINSVKLSIPRSDNFIRTLNELLKKFKDHNKNKKSKESVKRRSGIYKGLMILGILLLIIIPILMSADKVFEAKILNLTDNISFNIDDLEIFRVICVCILVYFNVSFLRGIRYKSNFKEYKIKWKKNMQFETSIIVYIGLIIIYGLFSVIQFSYLYGNGSGQLPDGMIYSSYARRGFFELVFITVLNIGIIFIIKSLMIDLCNKKKSIINICITLIIGFTYNILFSALYRMNLYIEEYGYTRLRVYVIIAIGILGIILLFMIIDTWKKGKKLEQHLLIILICVYIGVNIINIDGIIVRENIKNYNSGKDIDIVYIETMGWDAVAELIKLNEEGNIEYKSDLDLLEIGKLIADYRSVMGNEYDKWFEFNLSKEKVVK